ncbi:unnamed protein product [Rhizophagus irregularis]|nr:unnamed protein product [Rhizophagus irregularis]
MLPPKKATGPTGITYEDIKLTLEPMKGMLSKIFTTNDILKGYQFAGLPKKSTFEPLRIVNEIINYAEQNKKEMWFLMLDMSKAYDRVNIPMLENAMRRINLPE